MTNEFDAHRRRHLNEGKEDRYENTHDDEDEIDIELNDAGRMCCSLI